MSRLYADEMHDPALWPHSYWRDSAPRPESLPALHGERVADAVMIGAGYAGLNAALELVERFGMDVVMLEAAQPGWGASGRNGGFCCLGGAHLNDARMTRAHGPDAAREWQGFERAGVDHVRALLARHAIEADQAPEGELCLAHSPRAFAAMRAEGGGEILDRHALEVMGMAGPGFHGGRLKDKGFGLNPMKYVLGLERVARAKGVRIHGDSAVTALTLEGGRWRVGTATGHVLARRVLIATNGYSDERLPPWLGGRILPVISSIMVTRPLSTAELSAQGWTSHVMAYDSRRVLHYFRLLPDGRFLFGGRGGTSGTRSGEADFAQTLRAEFEALFPAFRHARSTHHWNGLICMTANLTPFCAEVPGAQGLFAALGWHGNGVAAASEGGRRIAHAIAGRANPAPRVTQAPLKRFPLPALRRTYLRAGIMAARIMDGPLR